MKVGIIRNPVAGRVGVRRQFGVAENALRRYFPELEIFLTAGSDHAAGLAEELCGAGFDLVIAAGGDGTISAVADGILRSARPQTPMSIIPLGTGSDFARNFAVPADPDALAERIAKADIRSLDAGLMRLTGTNGKSLSRHFVNIVSVGVSGAIVRVVNAAGRRRVLPGSWRFFLYSLREILRYRPASVRVIVDGREIHAGPVTAVAVANGAWFGGGMHVAPMADPSDGIFEVIVMRAGSRLSVIGILQSVYSAAHVGNPLVSFHRGRSVELLPMDGDVVLVDADGEAPGIGPLRVEIRPLALRLKI